MPEKPLPQHFKDVINDQTTKEEFEAYIRSVLTKDDKKTLGESAFELVRDSMLFVSVFTPDPATFDFEAYQIMNGDSDYCDTILMPPEKAEQLIEISIREKIISRNGEGKFILDKEAQSVLNWLFKYYQY